MEQVTIKKGIETCKIMLASLDKLEQYYNQTSAILRKSLNPECNIPNDINSTDFLLSTESISDNK